MIKIPFCFIFISILSIYVVNTQYLSDHGDFDMIFPSNCSSKQYYDTMYLRCQECDSTKIGTMDHQSCVCPADAQPELAASQINCIACPEGKHCKPCIKNSCFCKNNEISMMNDDGYYQCKTCPNGTFPNDDHTLCSICEDISCYCQIQECTSTIKRDGLESDIRGDNGEIRSPFLEETFYPAAVACENGSKKACQKLANLCTLQNFEKQGSTSCSILDQLQRTLNIWPYANIPLFFPSDFESELNKEYIEQTFLMGQDVDNAKLRIVLARFNLEGEEEMIEDPAESFQLCRDNTNPGDSFVFGRVYHKTCSVSYTEKLKSHSGYFFEAYIIYETSEEKRRIYQIPILNRNIRFNGNTPNMDSKNNDKWILTKRFFLVDDYTNDINVNNTAVNLRYANEIIIHVPVRPTRDGHINSPYIEISYSEIHNLEPNNLVPASYQVVYETDPARHDKDVEISMAVLAPISILWAALQAYSWGRRNGKQLLSDASTIVTFLFFSASVLSDVFFLLTAIIAVWITISYKLQTYMFYVLLNEEQEKVIVTYVVVALILKFITLIHRNISLIRQQTFFIDWERPRINQITNKNTPVSSDITKNPTEHPVVVWRTYLVANEWNELQNYRKTSLAFQIICLIFCMDYLGWQNFSLAEPGFSTEAKIPGVESTLLTRYAILVLVYYMILTAQWVVQVVFIERIIEDPFHNFIDLCSIANISVISMTDSLYGYYIHGRSVHGTADTGMAEMNNFLQKEKDNLCGNRGLEAGSELQTFRVCLPQHFRNKYDDILKTAIVHSSTARLSGLDSVTAKVANTVRAHQQMNIYLQELIDHSLSDTDYVIRNRTFIESLIDVDINDTAQIGNFIRDTSEIAFSRCFLYGNEWVNQSFEAALICILYLYFDNLPLSCTITYILSWVIRAVTASLSTNNLVKTSLIDKRFLI